MSAIIIGTNGPKGSKSSAFTLINSPDFIHESTVLSDINIGHPDIYGNNSNPIRLNSGDTIEKADSTLINSIQSGLQQFQDFNMKVYDMDYYFTFSITVSSSVPYQPTQTIETKCEC